jgi:chemosensory pili system protein ChpC
MSDTTTQTARLTSLTGLLIPLSDRHLLLPNVAVAELIDYQDSVADPAAPQWYLGPINWRHRSLPLLSFEAACGSRARVGGRARIVVLNALGGRPDLKFIALLTQGDVPLAELELAAVQVGETVAKIPDLVALEEWLMDAGLVQVSGAGI